MTTADEVLFTVDARVATITLNRPDTRNALNGAVITGLNRCLDQVSEHPDIGVAVLRGAGGTFCAGADLGSGMASQPRSFLDEHEGRGDYARLLRHMNACRKPILAAIEGYCLAGGMGLCLASDMSIAAEDAQFGTPEIKRGLWPYMVTALLIRNVGRKKGRSAATIFQVAVAVGSVLGILAFTYSLNLAVGQEYDRFTFDILVDGLESGKQFTENETKAEVESIEGVSPADPYIMTNMEIDGEPRWAWGYHVDQRVFKAKPAPDHARFSLAASKASGSIAGSSAERKVQTKTIPAVRAFA